MKPIHEELKEIRQEKGVSIETISRETKIRIDFLEKLEQGDFSFIPMPYIRAFLREYAAMIGIDPGRMLLRLENKIDSLLPSPPREEKKELPPSTIEAHQEPVPEETITKTGPADILQSHNHNDVASSASEGQPADTIQTTLFEEPAAPRKKKLRAPAGPKEEIAPKTKSSGQTPPDSGGTSEPEGPAIAGLPADDRPETPEIHIYTPPRSEIPEPVDVTGAEEETAPETLPPRKPLVIEEPGSSNRIVFVVFMAVLVIIAAIIIILNRNSLF